MAARRVFCGVFAAVLSGAAVWGGIPEPDVVLYGQVFINRLLQDADADLTVIARVDGVANPVATYHMGDNTAIGDRYALRIRLESLADGSAQSDDAAIVGQTAHIFIQEGSGTEQPVTDFPLTDRGLIQYLDLGERLKGDWNGDATVSLLDVPNFVECMKGPVPTSGQCVAAYDFDGNSTVDLADFGGLQGAMAAK